MPRPRRDHLPSLGEAAYAVFLSGGYRQSLVQEVADRLGLAVGTIYREVLGKEALFELAVRHAFDLPMPDSTARPLPGASPDQLEALVREAIAAQFQCPVLDAAGVAGEAPERTADLRAVLHELYGLCSRQRRAILLLDRCARDFPALGRLHLELVKAPYLQRFENYLARSMAKGRVAGHEPVAGIARAAMEAVVWMAIHRHRDALPPEIPEAAAADCVVELLLGGLLPRRDG